MVEVAVGEAEAVPGSGLADAITRLPQQGQGLLAADQGLMVVTELSLEPADGVERAGLPVRVIGGPEVPQRPPSVVESLSVTTLSLERPRQGEVGLRLADPVVELLEQGQGLPDVVDGVRVTAYADEGAGEAAVSEGLRQWVAQPAAGR